MARKRIGDLLHGMGMITAEQLEDVLETQKQTKERLGEIIISKGYVTEEQMIEVLEFQLGIPHVNLYRLKIDPTIVQTIPEALARRYLAFAIKKDKNKLTVAMADPLDFYAIEDIRMSTGFTIEPAIAAKEEIRRFLERYYGLRESVDELRAMVPKDEELGTEITDEDSPVVRLVNQIIHQALQQRASDIHVDPALDGLRIRYRVDGMLRTEQLLPKSMQSIVVARIKIMANLNIAERRLPQDGRMQIEAELRPVDIRVSTLPTVHGEKCVMRLLDTKNAVLEISKLGMTKDNLSLFEKMIHAVHGIVLITGPTGSGKTSTLYAALQSLPGETRNIVTIEDPVEYQLAGVNQVQVNPAAGLTFAKGLRSILRHDPDIVMVGEIRDAETAELAIRSALTGHLVFSTLHTNDAVSSVTRLVDMGVEPFLIASSLVGVVAQRLVRKVCTHCATQYRPTDAESAFLEQRGFPVSQLVVGKGCGTCAKTGYRGRLAIQEVLWMDDDIRAVVVNKRPDSDYRRHIANRGVRTLLDDGLEKAASGQTTLSEVMRVTMRE
jgi:type IV pilus assembly protein PilB